MKNKPKSKSKKEVVVKENKPHGRTHIDVRLQYAMEQYEQYLYQGAISNEDRNKMLKCKIRIAMLRRRYTLEELSEKISGSANTVNQILNTDSFPRIDTLFKLEDALGISLINRKL